MDEDASTAVVAASRLSRTSISRSRSDRRRRREATSAAASKHLARQISSSPDWAENPESDSAREAGPSVDFNLLRIFSAEIFRTFEAAEDEEEEEEAEDRVALSRSSPPVDFLLLSAEIRGGRG